MCMCVCVERERDETHTSFLLQHLAVTIHNTSILPFPEMLFESATVSRGGFRESVPKKSNILVLGSGPELESSFSMTTGPGLSSI